MKTLFACLTVGALAVAGCTMDSTVQPLTANSPSVGVHVAKAPINPQSGRTAPGSPGYEPAFVNGQTVTINAIEVPNVAPEKAMADFYEVVYPNGWQNLGIGTPQCNPCDHDGNGIDAEDFHDHILDSMPSSPGHGEFSPLWHVYVVVPAYNGDPTHDTQVTAAYASHIPTKSESAVDALLASRLASGAPVAVEIDTHFYFLCAVVDPHAMK